MECTLYESKGVAGCESIPNRGLYINVKIGGRREGMLAMTTTTEFTSNEKKGIRVEMIGTLNDIATLDYIVEKKTYG